MKNSQRSKIIIIIIIIIDSLSYTNTRYVYIKCLYLHYEGTHGVTVIIVGNRVSCPNLNPEQGCLHFTFGKVRIQLFSPQL